MAPILPEVKEEKAAIEAKSKKEDKVLTDEMESDTKSTKPEIVEEEKEQLPESSKEGNLEDDSGDVYEDMEVGEESDSQELEDKPEDEYENVTYEAQAEDEERATGVLQQKPAPGKVYQHDEAAPDLEGVPPRSPLSRDVVSDATTCMSPGYVHMEPAPSLRTDSDYEPMKDGVIVDNLHERESTVTSQASTDKYEYEEPEAWVPPPKELSPPYDTLPPTKPFTPSHSEYDIPKSSGTQSPNKLSQLAPETDARHTSIGSASSLKSDGQARTSSAGSSEAKAQRSGSGSSVAATNTDGEDRRRGSSNASKKSGEALPLQRNELHRDSFGVSETIILDCVMSKHNECFEGSCLLFSVVILFQIMHHFL